MPKFYGLKKGEIIKNELVIKRLLSNNNKLFVYPLLVKWEIEFSQSSHTHIQSAFIVSKKRFSKATTRNLIKRRLKESYRKNKNIFQNVNFDLHLKILFIYVSNNVENFQTIDQAVQQLMQKILLSILDEKSS